MVRRIKRFNVSQDYLLKGTNGPLAAIWKPVAPGHPKHMPALATDLENGVPKLFKELEINFVVKVKNVSGEHFMLCGNDPENEEWKLNYLLIYDTSLDEILTAAVRSSGSKIIKLEDTLNSHVELVDECEDEMNMFYGKFPDCLLLTDRLISGEIESDEFTLEGLLIRFGELARERDITDNDVIAISKYVAEEIENHSGFRDIKISSNRLLENAALKVRIQSE